MDNPNDPWDWDAWLRQTPTHVTSIIDRIHQQARENSSLTLKDYPSPALIDPETGHLTGGELCWLCYGTRPFRAPRLPKFRACRYCLRRDRIEGQKLGLKMLLPLMGWHCQPILLGSHFPADPHVRKILKDVWSSGPLLEDWRKDNVRREYALLYEPGDPPVHLAEWCQHVGMGDWRSKRAWWDYVNTYFPALKELLEGGT